MSSYTMQLKECLEMWTQDEAISTRDRIEKGRSKLFDFDYPIFDEAYKKVFETHFIRKFYMREIGFETEGRFKYELETWLLIHMPYFNKMFESELLEFDPLINTKIETTHNKTVDKDQTQDTTTDGTNNSVSVGESDGTLIDDSFNRRLESNNPDSRLTITSNDGEGVIEYASSIDENNENSSKTSTNNTSGTTDDTTSVVGHASAVINEIEDFVESKTGKSGNQTYSKMINEYRSSLIRVESKIFDEMQELFMLVY
jgi:hypothetical protein